MVTTGAMQEQTTIFLNPDAPVVLVDGSYYVFHRFFATQRWYSFRVPDLPEPMSDPVFVAALQKHVEADLAKFRAGMPVKVAKAARGPRKPKAPPATVVFCADCPREDIWRMVHYPEYKGTREASQGFQPAAFDVVYEHLRALGIPVIGVPQLEADDVVKLSRDEARAAGHAGPFVLVTNDNDYLQLRDDTTRIINMQGKDLGERGTGDPRMDLRLKTLVGDKSDNIPAVCSGLGPKTARGLAALEDDEAVRGALRQKGGDAAVAMWERNRLLVCMDAIPLELVQSMREAIAWRAGPAPKNEGPLAKSI